MIPQYKQNLNDHVAMSRYGVGRTEGWNECVDGLYAHANQGKIVPSNKPGGNDGLTEYGRGHIDGWNDCLLAALLG